MTTQPSTAPLDEHSAGTTREGTGSERPIVTTTGETVVSRAFPPEPDPVQADERWQNIQAQFVDDPRRAVSEAHQLVGELIQRISDAFAQEREELEAEWSPGNDISTEGLRVCLQHYRSFISRLVPSAKGLQPR